MKTQKEKAINLIWLGVALKFVPVLILQVIFPEYFKDSSHNLSPVYLPPLLSFLFYSLFLIGYRFFIEGCCLYIESKGYSYKWGWLGLLSLPSLSLFLLLPFKKNAATLQSLENESLVNKPFEKINILELLLFEYTALPCLFLLMFGIFCLLNNLNYFHLIENSSVIKLLLDIIIAVGFGFVLFKEIKNAGLVFNKLIGHKKSIDLKDLKLISIIVVFKLAFAYGFNSLLLYKLSFVFPGYVEEYINEKDFTNIWGMILRCFSVMILAPLIEEFFFRGIILQKWVIKWGVKAGILTSSLLFAVLHFRFDIIYLFFAGILYSILYFKTRNLMIPILCHFFHNTIVTIFNAIDYFSQSTIERSGLISVKDYQALIQPLLGQRFFLMAIPVPFLIYFVYKNFPLNAAIIPYYANDLKG